MPTILFLTGPRTGTRLTIVGDKFVLGRASGCDAVISSTTPSNTGSVSDGVSRHHAIIRCCNGQWFIEDGDGQGKASRNGTRLNGKRVVHPTRALLQHNDQISICELRFTFQLDPESTFTPEASVSHTDSRLALEGQSAERLCALLEISHALRSTLEPDTVLDRTLEHLFRMFPQAERGLVILRDDPTSPLVVRAVKTPSGAPGDPGFSTTVVRRCLEGVEAVLGDDLPTQFPDTESLPGLAVRSLMCAPLWATDGQALGVVQVDTTSSRKFTPDDLRLLLGVANQASVSLSNARLHRETLALHRRTRDLEVAQQVQRALLPGCLPKAAGYAFFAHYDAADEVGGDYYDFVPLPGGRLAVLLGDVAGHGVAAALVMARFGAEARACLELETDPERAIVRLNALVLRAAVPDSFVTLAAAVLDQNAHEATIICAGHPSPLLRRANGLIEELVPEEAIGLPLGIAEPQRSEVCKVRLGVGESVLLFSDGVTDALDSNDRQFSLEGVRRIFTAAGPAPQAIVEALAKALQRHGAGCEQNDDITVVCLGRTGN